MKCKFSYRILSVFLSFLIVFNVSFKPVFADAVATPVAMQVLATILASMGVLEYSEDLNGDFVTTFNDMSNYADTALGKDFRLMLFDVFKSSFLDKSKMKIDEIKDVITSYFSSKVEIPDVPLPDISAKYVNNPIYFNTFSRANSLTSDVVTSMRNRFSMDKLNSYYFTYKEVNVGNGFTLVIGGPPNTGFADNRYIRIYLRDSNNNQIGNSSDYIVTGRGIPNYANGLTIDYGLSYSYNSSVAMINYYAKVKGPSSSSILGEVYEKTVTFDYSKFIDTVIIDDEKSPPYVVSPSSVAFPYGQFGINPRDFLGQKLDDLIGSLSLVPLKDVLDNLKDVSDYGKSTTFELDADGTILDVNEEVDSGNPAIPGVPVVDVPDLPVVDVPGFGWLVDILTSLYNLIRSLFNIVNSFLSNLIKALLDLLKFLFVPSADVINSYVSAMELSLKNKWGNNLYVGLFDKLKLLKGVPIPDLFIKGNKVLDASYVNSFADVVRSWQRWLYYIMIALYNMNGIYKLIRNGEMIGRSGGVKK